ncbi:MAG: heme ABC exporter ATP-binding protein CcmA [Magnetovibrionaceae bacterium]
MSNGFAGDDLLCVRGERTIFSSLSFRLEPGGGLVLIGPNGTGKTSLLRVMAGLIKPALGDLTWNGEPISEDPEAHGGRLHYIGHHDAIKPVLSVSENLSFWSKLRGHDLGAVERGLEAFAIPHLMDVPGRFLSAGQRRRATLARLIAAPSPLWLLDEPTTALDKATIKDLERLIQEHRDGGGMVVLSTHADIDMPGATLLDLAEFTHMPGRRETEAEDAA